MRDPDYFVEEMSLTEFYSKFRELSEPDFEFGFHLSQRELKAFSSLPDNFNLPVQIMSGPALTLSRSSEVFDHVRDLVSRNAIQLFIHSPFPISPWMDYHNDDYVSRFYHGLGKIWEGVDVKGVVIHSGYNQNMDSLNESESRDIFNRDSSRIIDNLNRWQESLGVSLLLENLAGSHKYSVNPASLDSINSLFSSNRLDPRIGICYDSEHSYASGDSIEDLVDLIKSFPDGLIKLCHCNSCPENVKHGSHIDLHSYTAIEDSLGRVFSDSFWNIFEYKRLFKGVPKIFERSVYSVMLADYRFMVDSK